MLPSLMEKLLSVAVRSVYTLWLVDRFLGKWMRVMLEYVGRIVW